MLWLVALAPPSPSPYPEIVLVQNPPALPILPVAWFFALVRGADLVIDWHNLGKACRGGVRGWAATGVRVSRERKQNTHTRTRPHAGFTMLAMALGKDPASRSLPVAVCKFVERWCARRASAHLCVTHAMSDYLRRDFGVQATVLHDRPPSFFRTIDVASKHDLFQVCG